MDCSKKAPPRRAGVVGMLKSVSSMTNGEMKMKNKMIGLVMVMMLAAGTAFAADNVDVSVTVTPGVTLTLTVSATTYAFGIVNLSVSSGAVSAQTVTLTNGGDVAINVQKKVQTEPAAWTAGAAKAANVYALYVTTSAAQPAYGTNNAGFNASCLFLASNASNALTSITAGTSVIAAAGTARLWFGIDMPTSSSSSAAQRIITRFTAIAN